jgi:hypothetical protein
MAQVLTSLPGLFRHRAYLYNVSTHVLSPAGLCTLLQLPGYRGATSQSEAMEWSAGTRYTQPCRRIQGREAWETLGPRTHSSSVATGHRTQLLVLCCIADAIPAWKMNSLMDCVCV